MVDFYGKLVGKYTRPMDTMGTGWLVFRNAPYLMAYILKIITIKKKL